MDWQTFKQAVGAWLTVDDDRLGPIQALKDQAIRAGVRDLQRDIPVYRELVNKTYQVQDLVLEQNASIGNLPDEAQVKDGFYVQTGRTCIRRPLVPYRWGNRHDMVCGAMGTWDYAIAIDPYGKQFFVYPAVIDGTELDIYYDKLKADYADADETPFDEQMAQAVSSYVMARIALKVDLDVTIQNEYKVDYRREKSRLTLDAKDRRRVSLTAHSPQEQPTCKPQATDDDDYIEFIFAADTGMGDTNSALVASVLKPFNPDFLILGGDNNYPYGDAVTMDATLLNDYDGYVPNYMYPAWGNHDLQSTSGGIPGGPLMDVFPNIALLNSGKRYYDFTKGQAHFFVLNSGDTNASPKEDDGITYTDDGYGNITEVQAAWFKATIEASASPWKIVIIHRPPYSSDSAYGDNADLQWPFDTLGVDLVLSGHTHTYERILINGLTYINEGRGGAALRSFGTLNSNSQFRYSELHGFTRVSITAKRLQLAAYTVLGDVVDNFSLYKEDASGA